MQFNNSKRHSTIDQPWMINDPSLQGLQLNHDMSNMARPKRSLDGAMDTYQSSGQLRNQGL